ncbi:MAG: hypothetical protein MHM6MM_004173 [Cercozoa sp. M6MM]
MNGVTVTNMNKEAGSFTARDPVSGSPPDSAIGVATATQLDPLFFDWVSAYVGIGANPESATDGAVLGHLIRTLTGPLGQSQSECVLSN